MEPARDAFYQPPHRTMIPYPPPVSQYPPFMPHSYAATASHFGQAHLGQPSATLNASYAFPSFGGVGLPFPEQLAPGLYFMTSLCSRLYPNQLNPMQATALTKFWLGGPDPLDYISMYENPGDPKQQIPPHWHYISFGLSDLYGDGRVHEPHGPDTPSGFGFELTFRLKREPNETSPPAWPSTVMQSLAKYVFQTENVLCPGDHVSWHCSLDNSESRIQHMLMTDDPQLGTIHGPFGQITFIQIVGVTVEELQAAQQWNGSGVIDLMKSVPNAGGPFLVTNMKRDRSIFELDEEVKEAVEDGINAEGSNLSGVSAKCSFKPKISYEYVIDTKDEYDNSDDDEDGSGSTSDNDEEDDSEPFGSSGEATEESGAEDESNGSTQNCGNKENNSADLNQAMASKTTADANTATNDVSEVNTLNEAISHIKLNETSSGGATSATEMESEVPHRSCSQNQTNRDASQARSSSRCTSTLNANQRTLMSPCKSEASSSMSVSHEPQTHGHSLSRMSYTSETGAMEPNDFLLPRFFKQVHITINLEAGLLLPLALRGRLKHNHHFTFKSNNLAITLLTPSISGACVTESRPYAIYGSWLQILLTNDFVNEILTELENIDQLLKPDLLPRTLCWNRRNLAITFMPEETPKCNSETVVESKA